MNEYLPATISALATIISAFFAYNQYAKNKMVDVKIEKWKKDEELKSDSRNGQIAKIYGELWELLHKLKADRAYIIQPHPLINNLYISISLEVRRNGISEIKRSMHNMKMADIASYTSELARREWLVYRNIEEDVKDKRARAIMTMNGCKSVVVKRLSDDGDRWVGSLNIDFTTPSDFNIDYVKREMSEAAQNIEYVLPEYKITSL